MTAQGKANYDAYLAALPDVVCNVSRAPYEELPSSIRHAFDAGADAVEAWLAELPVDEDAPGNEPKPITRYALVEQMGHRSTTGTITETTFCGRPMLELTALDTGRTHLIDPQSLYEITWLTEAEARQRVARYTPTST